MIDRQKLQTFRARCQSKEIVVGTLCSTVSPVMTEAIGYAGFDFVIIDTEVLSINLETMEHMIRAAECSGTIPMVKVKSNDPIMIADAVNAGAAAVKVPHIRNVGDLKRAMDATYFPPKGHRGLCPVARVNKYGQGKMSEAISFTNELVMLLPLLEDKEAVENIDEIMAFEGVEVYDIGPVDLSASYGVPPEQGLSNPIIAEAVDKIIVSAKKYGKQLMTVPYFGSGDQMKLAKEKLIDRGVHIFFYFADSHLFKLGAQEAMRLRTLG